eukprot:COSAG02_NODE_11106_length_1792_cov_1.203190_2_plen_87_part_00
MIICVWRKQDGDFTEVRGTTRAVLRSRHWDRGRPDPKPEDSVGAVMPRGSCFLYSGRTFHGSGENQTRFVRLTEQDSAPDLQFLLW